jgi:hypothetical protein
MVQAIPDHYLKENNMSELENWCNDKGLSPQQKVEVKKQFNKHGGGTAKERDKSLFNFLSKKDPKELAEASYVFCSATMGQGSSNTKITK